MPPAQTSAQKAAVTQFVAVTNTDRTTAARILKSHGWNLDQAVNGYFSGSNSLLPGNSAAKASLNKVFDQFRDQPVQSPDTVGVEGTMGYLQSIGVNLEDIGMLVVSELVGSPSMGEMTREGFVEGWLSTGADSTDRQKRHVASLLRTLPSDPAHFARVYKHTFAIARPPSARTLPLDMAVEYWKVLFASPSSPTQWTARAGGGVPWLEHWTAFLTTRWNKAVNRDVWDQTLKFAQRCVADPSLAWWSEESAWPGVVDEFVEWLRAEKGVGRREGRGTAEEPMEIE